MCIRDRTQSELVLNNIKMLGISQGLDNQTNSISSFNTKASMNDAISQSSQVEQNQFSQQPIQTDEQKYIGSYTKKERMQKIQKYKQKIEKWKKAHPVSRKFKGRSAIASIKPRVNGRFIKMSSNSSNEYGKDEYSTQSTSQNI
eukprot:TRINITY_DN8996_c0_g1_i2.p2 TRINITY_DN8996_c0_g1~~TRINITY_DN8996_c0_g1_i2.p2  ORF type:complete len:144 (+),score=29.43 TRINITY_DN8996_c0_g1_i2:125-556(+)